MLKAALGGEPISHLAWSVASWRASLEVCLKLFCAATAFGRRPRLERKNIARPAGRWGGQALKQIDFGAAFLPERDASNCMMPSAAHD